MPFSLNKMEEKITIVIFTHECKETILTNSCLSIAVKTTVFHWEISGSGSKTSSTTYATAI